MRSKLTEEDVTWLEDSLCNALEPVNPRRDFVDHARVALFDGSYDEIFDSRIAAIPLLSLAMLLLGLSLFTSMLWRRRWYWHRRF